MRKVAAILLLLILLFNWLGYRLLADYILDRADRKLESKLDMDDYDPSQLIEIKIPLHLPYQTNWADFERCDGEVEIDGVHYKYVKRKVSNNSLILLCLPNEEKMKIENAKDNFYKLVNDLQAASSKKGTGKSDSPSFKNILSEYFLYKIDWETTFFSSSTIFHRSKNSNSPGSLYIEVAERPPDC